MAINRGGTPGVRPRRSRFCLLLLQVVAGQLLAFGVFGTAPAHASVNDNPIVLENQQAGTSNWEIGRPGFSISDDTNRQIQGYASATSVNKGGSISFAVTVNPVQNFTADIYRMGWYAGLGARQMAQVGPIAGTNQRVCAANSTTGLVDCGWSQTFSYTIPTSWTSGIYLVLLTNAQNYQSYMTFVVRDDSRTADLLFQQSVTTYQAYNNYPAGAGKSLYEFNSYGATLPATGTIRAAKISFDRPYSDGFGSGQFAGYSANWERYFVGWLEQSGYDVAYSTNLDTHTSGSRLLNFKGFLSIGHDEYWSKAMVDAATNARDAGTNLGFFGSNTAYWQIRFEPSVAGVPNRVIVCYKSASADPVKDSNATVLWRDPPVNRPEQGLVGIQYTAHLQNEGAGAMYVVQNSSHWVWEGTGFTQGSQVAGILGYETDRLMQEYAPPTSTSYAILSTSPVVDAAGRSDYANSSIYQAPSGAWVFATGTNQWSFGLGKPGVTDSRIQRATANVLNRFLGNVPPPPTTPAAPSGLTASAVSSSDVDLSWSDNSSNESSFVVEHSPDGTNWSELTSLDAESTSYRVTGLTPTTTYRYRVKAMNGAGSSSYSNVATVTTPAQTAVVFAESFPGADGSSWDPSRWTVSNGSTASTDVQGGGGRMSFQNVSGARAQAIATMPRQADSDTMASFRYSSTAARGYFYLLARASGDWAGGYASASYFVQITNDITNVQLWKSQAGTTTSLGSLAGVATITTAKQWVRFRVQGNTVSVKVWTDGTAEPANWELTATDSSITSPGVVQTMWVRGGTATASRDVILDDISVAASVQAPVAPSGLAATAVSSSAIDLAWADNASNETGYTVERSPDGAAWTVVTSALPAAATSYRDAGLSASTAYSYRVKATNAAGGSPYSNVATATTASPASALFAESFPGPNGSSWDAGRWTTSNGTTASTDVQSGSGRMSFQNVSGARAQAVATMTPQSNTETLMSFKYSSAATRGQLYLFARASGDWVSGFPNASYLIQITGDTTVQMLKSQAGATTTLASQAGVASVSTAKQWVRYRVQGSTLSVKVWTDGTAEPANWELSTTDASITSQGVLQVKWARVGTGGAGRDIALDDITVTNLGG